ncbi:hypothetical protein AB6A40_006855 [Gnathostoma spinigerum]|uniref:Neurotrophin-3 n=1 Tax=Gnathostoma spinigerum TaxID=75299 RepID=A0ABD6ELL3_9BILA
MEADLSFISTDMNLEEVQPLEIKRVIAFVNFFLTRATRTLSSFASKSELKIYEMENRLDRIEISLRLLEAKLDSVPGISSIGRETVKVDKEIISEPKAISIEVVGEPQINGTVSSDATNKEKRTDELSSNAVNPEIHFIAQLTSQDERVIPAMKNKDDPRYSKYFKMLRLVS